MYELYCLFGCFIVPLALVMLGVVMYTRRPAAKPSPLELLPAMRQRIEAWVAEGRLSHEQAAPVLRVVLADLQPTVAPVVQPVAAKSPLPVAPAVVAQPTPSIQPIKPPQPAVPPRPPEPSRAERAWAGLLALRTRQMLLFLGAFLLVVSSLVLVVFNWNAFPPLFQCGLLVTVCSALWGAGEWLERRWSMHAGAGLRAVAGVLAPIVGGAITRLLQIAPHPAWLVVSLVCLVLYVLAARRTKQQLFGVAASLAGASVVLAACGFISWPALPAVLCFALVGYLPLSRWLRRAAPVLAASPQWTAHALVPATLFIAGALHLTNIINGVALGAALTAGTLFYASAALLDRRAVWSWAASALGAAAMLAFATALQPERPALWALALVTIMALYLSVARLLRMRNLPALALAPHAIAHGVVPATLFGTALWSFGTVEGSLVLGAGFVFYLLALIYMPIARWSRLAALVLPVTLVSACFAFDITAQTTIEAVLLTLAALYIGLSRGLQARKHTALAAGPFAVAHVLAPLVAGNVLLTFAPTWPHALLLWSVAGFYFLALALERRAIWLWPAMACVPIALATSCAVADIDPTVAWAALSVLVLGYTTFGVVLDVRARWWALPGYVLGALLGGLIVVGGLLQGTEALQWSLPALVAACALFVAATHRARLQWLGTNGVAAVSSVTLGIGTLLLATWAWVACEAVLPQTAWRAVALLPLAAVAFAAARFWPGPLRTGYPLALRIAATTLAITFAPLSLAVPNAAVAGFGLLTVVWAVQLVLQRHASWASTLR